MEIKFNSPLPRVMPAGQPAAQPSGVNGFSDLSLTGSEALNRDLAALPAVRPEAVERGKALVASADYPPQEIGDRIARLLATAAEDKS